MIGNDRESKYITKVENSTLGVGRIDSSVFLKEARH